MGVNIEIHVDFINLYVGLSYKKWIENQNQITAGEIFHSFDALYVLKNDISSNISSDKGVLKK